MSWSYDTEAALQTGSYLTDGLVQVVPPHVEMLQGVVDLQSPSQRQQTLRPDVVAPDAQPDRKKKIILNSLITAKINEKRHLILLEILLFLSVYL